MLANFSTDDATDEQKVTTKRTGFTSFKKIHTHTLTLTHTNTHRHTQTHTDTHTNTSTTSTYTTSAELWAVFADNLLTQPSLQ